VLAVPPWRLRPGRRPEPGRRLGPDSVLDCVLAL